MSFKDYLNEAEAEIFPTDETIMGTVEEADNAFWQIVQKAFPTLIKKEFDPKQSEEFKKIEFATIKNWLQSNWPKID
jgi:hypothetical protein